MAPKAERRIVRRESMLSKCSHKWVTLFNVGVGVRSPETEVAGSCSGLPTFACGTSFLQTRRAAALDVNSLHGVHEAASRGDTAGRDHLQCADLDESARPSGGAIPDGGR